ncbi:MAG: hypothetical protein V8R64_02470 [Thomasclavelia sp.]
MELKETVDMMKNQDYKERFKAEYYQLKIRYDGLSKMIEKYENGTLNFKPKCNINLFKKQAQMFAYLQTCQLRAEIENIKL